jgi:ParB-like chromosome segregation protein Spo0J
MPLPWMAAKILLRPVAELRAHPGNARVHGAAQIEQIKASMLAFGFTNPLLVDEAGVLIAGHGRLEAAVALGIEKVPTIVLRHLSAAQKEALRLADNRIAGSGTTILAGQRTERRVRAIELAPAYVDLAVARWRMLHPDVAVTLADDGRGYDAVAAARMEVTADAA